MCKFLWFLTWYHHKHCAFAYYYACYAHYAYYYAYYCHYYSHYYHCHYYCHYGCLSELCKKQLNSVRMMQKNNMNSYGFCQNAAKNNMNSHGSLSEWCKKRLCLLLCLLLSLFFFHDCHYCNYVFVLGFCMVLYDHYFCMILYGLCITFFLLMILYDLYESIWFCMILYDFVLLCFFCCAWFCMSLYECCIIYIYIIIHKSYKIIQDHSKHIFPWFCIICVWFVYAY